MRSGPRWIVVPCLLGLLAGGAGCQKSSSPSASTANPSASRTANDSRPAASVAAAALPDLHPPAPKLEKAKLFTTGPKPDLCLMLSGQMMGYLQPCGCARPQVGGLERRFELVKELQALDIPVTAADVGDLAPKETGQQPRMKYETSMRMLKEMPYAAIGIGSTEIDMDLEQALGIAQNYQPPWCLAANLEDPGRFPEMYKSCFAAQPKPGGLKVGFVGVVGEKVANSSKAKEQNLKFQSPEAALPKALDELKKEKPDLWVLIFQGSPAEATALHEKFPDAFQVILSKSDADIASALPTVLKGPSGKETLLITVGHKGRSVGLVGVNREGENLKLRYQMVDLTEPYELADDKTNPVRELMREYVRAVFSENLLSKVPKTQHALQLIPGMEKATFVGAGKCMECHPTAHKTWHGSKHQLGWENLGKYGRPLAERDDPKADPKIVTRQYDPECASCHVTGFGYHGGFIDEKKTPYLFGNQCENCHGPGSLHVETSKNANECDPKYAVPLRLNIAAPETEKKCRVCHDSDNDPHFDLQKYWPHIKHGKETGPAPK